MKKIMLLITLLASPAIAQTEGGPPQVFSSDGTYLGNLDGNPYNLNSITNEYGRYGSPYTRDGINNPYGKYGSSVS